MKKIISTLLDYLLMRTPNPSCPCKPAQEDRPEIFWKTVRLNEKAYTPTKRADDSDYDLRASVDVTIQPGQTAAVPTNVSIEFPVGWEGKLENKSGVSLKGITVLGGVIDHMFTGEIQAIMYNSSVTPYTFEQGHKVVQLKLRRCSPDFVFKEVFRPLHKTERGDKGFGSQGL